MDHIPAEVVSCFPPFRVSPATTAIVEHFTAHRAELGYCVACSAWPAEMGFPWTHGTFRSAQKELERSEIYVLWHESHVEIVSAEQWAAYLHGRSRSGARIRKRSGHRLAHIPRSQISKETAARRDLEVLCIEAASLQEATMRRRYRALTIATTCPVRAIEQLAKEEAEK